MDKENEFRRYAFDDPQKNKCMKLFCEAIISNLKDYVESKVNKLSYDLTVSLYETYFTDIPKMVRSKALNLKDKNNPKLCKDVYEGKISPDEYIRMSSEEMQSIDLKREVEKAIQDSFYDAQIPELKAETEIFKCAICGQRKASYRQLQTRSADEPMTTFVTCVCGHKWKF
ncbi:Transcription elongation factor S-II [Nosema bombycis CQ1]|jgi:transcription elongation factor S-II|uniref:Transcription elongation factor S-II n=1 Tax=Nosema bombycis (strain CQ1 / CVCC 102059) TaxID=578461 RepID=R0MIF9_NOSB1|nr:Transcription elongation factor S-II [Nosema bombycis CQ1]EOB13654.1 Transcription elongation factor S-II [Nosema bombycis CQ1]|eukprot:EOB12593.1 Transcription elongation factor S-II [Nosema bombycis CQ1]